MKRLLRASPWLAAIALAVVAAFLTGRIAVYVLCFFRFALDENGLDHAPEEISNFCTETRLKFPFGSYSPSR